MAGCYCRSRRRIVSGTSEKQRHASQPDDLLREVQIEEHSERNGQAAHSYGETSGFLLKARQILGQPACRGLAVVKARTVVDSEDLFNFQKGEILVCDAVDPAMTFVVPLAAGIVERRGGMLIHGSIITVDGHLGIVIIGEDG